MSYNKRNITSFLYFLRSGGHNPLQFTNLFHNKKILLLKHGTKTAIILHFFVPLPTILI